MRQALVVIVDGDGEALLGVVLTDDVAVEVFLNLPRCRDLLKEGLIAAGLFLFLADDVVAKIDAVGADEGVVRAFDHGSDFPMGLAAEAASAGATLLDSTGIVAARGRRHAAGAARRLITGRSAAVL